MKKLYFFSFLAVITFSSCHHPTKLVPVTDDTVAYLQAQFNKRMDSINQKALHQSNLLQTTSSSGDQENFWKAAFKACFTTDELKGNGLFSKRLLYLGPSNDKYLTSIFDSQIRFRTALDFLPKSELAKFIDTGKTVKTCTLTEVHKINADFIVGAGVLSSVDANLSTALTKADSIIITGGAWRTDVIRIDDFLKYIDTCTNPHVKDFKTSLDVKNHKVVTVIVKVEGFTAKAYLNKSLDAGVQANINSKLTAKLDSAKVSLKFKSSNNKQIDISSTNSFYVFVNLYTEESLRN